jgi:CheY-like chemotaxis protein
LRDAIEIAARWEAGQASIEELSNEIERAVTAYGRAGGWRLPLGYGRFDALNDAADLIRQALKTPSACLEHRPRILIVNDKGQLREIICSMLTSAGYKCEAVAGGLDALGLLEAGQKYDLLLTDLLNLPMDGFSLLQQTKARFPNMPVIVASSINDKGVIDACIREGAYHYLTLPFEREQLLDLVRCALKRQQQERVMPEERNADLRDELKVLRGE